MEILNIHRPDRITKTKNYGGNGQEPVLPVLEQIERRKWNWLYSGHVKEK